MGFARNTGFVALLVVAALLGSCGTKSAKKLEESGKPPLSAQEIKSRLIGNTIHAVGSDAVPFSVYFPAYGEMRGVHSFHYKDTGEWSIKDGEFCGKWTNWWAATQRCWKMYAAGSDLYWIRPDGTTLQKVSVERGNAESL